MEVGEEQGNSEEKRVVEKSSEVGTGVVALGSMIEGVTKKNFFLYSLLLSIPY